MEDNTALLYFFSTLAQSLAALAALPAIFVHFKTTAYLRLMVGLGQSMLDRWTEDYQYRNDFVPALGDEKEQESQYARLRGAVDRHDLAKIEEVMLKFVVNEQKLKPAAPYNGFEAMHKHFHKLNRDRKELGTLIAWCVVLALIGIVFALLGIGAIHGNWCCVLPLFIGMCTVFGSATLGVAGYTVVKGIEDPSEWQLQELPEDRNTTK